MLLHNHHTSPGGLILLLCMGLLAFLATPGCQSYKESYRDPVDNLRRMDPEDMQPEVVSDERQQVPATPDTIRHEQPDGYVLDIFLRGEKHDHVARTADGFHLIKNEDEFYEYAVRDEEGTLLTTGIIARNKADRPDEVQRFLENLYNTENMP